MEKIIVYGIGKNGTSFINNYKDCFEIIFLIDQKEIDSYLGFPVKKIDELTPENTKEWILITADSQNAVAIVKELKCKGFENYLSASAVINLIDKGEKNPILRMRKLVNRMYVYKEMQWQDIYTRNYGGKANIDCIEYDKAIILPPIEKDSKLVMYSGGVIDEKFNFIAGYSQIEKDEIHNGYAGFCSITESYDFDHELIERRNENVIYGGVVINHFGEFLVNSLSRLWYLLNSKNICKKIAYLKIDVVPLWAYEFWELLGIKRENIIIVESPTQFDKVFVPDESLHFFSSWYKQFRSIVSKIKTNVKPGKKKRIYLSKTKYSVGTSIPTLGESYFEQFYLNRGYEIVNLEEYSVYDKISIISGADEIVTTTGTPSHMVALFANTSAQIVFLNRNDEEPLYPQRILDRITEINPIYVDVSNAFLPAFWQSGVILIGPNQYWKKYAKDYYEVDILESEITEHQNAMMYLYVKKWMIDMLDHNMHNVTDKGIIEIVNRMKRMIV